jgi:putative membrane protein
MTRELGFRPVDPAAVPIETADPAQMPALVDEAAEGANALALPAAAPPRRRSPARWFAFSLALFVGGVLAVESIDWVRGMYERNAALGIGFSALLGIALTSAAWWTVWEVAQIRKLKVVEDLRAEVALLGGEGSERARMWIAKVESATATTPERARLFAQANDTILDTHSDADALLIFRRAVLTPLDEAAYRAVARAARATALGVSVSPVASIDAALVIWRSVRMVRQIAQIYGLRPGAAATIRLVRRLLYGALQSVAVDVLGDAWVQVLGHRFASVLSARLGEGVFAAVRVARLGILAIEQCRPLPFGEADRPSLMRLRGEIMDWRQ